VVSHTHFFAAFLFNIPICMSASVSPLAILVLITNTIIWGLSWTAFKSLRAYGMHPVWATAAIFAGCTVLLLLYRPKILREVKGHPELILVAIAAGMTNTAFNSAVAFGDVVRVILLFYLMPVWAIVLARLVLHEPITMRALARIVLGLSGAMIVLHQPGMGLPVPSSWVDWVALAGGMAFALNNIMLRRLQGVSDGARAITMLGGGGLWACLLGIVLSSVSTVAWPHTVDMAALPVLAAWVVLFLIANLCLQYSVARLPANVTAVVMLTEILIASVSAWMFGSAQLRAQDLIGGLLIISAPWLIRDKVRQVSV
jgi:drug/metabolite transporter (DMT)-like permease